jgi:hypothetical protein
VSNRVNKNKRASGIGGQGDNVTLLFTADPRKVPALTDEEITCLRTMLREWAKVRELCPMARRILMDE